MNEDENKVAVASRQIKEYLHTASATLQADSLDLMEVPYPPSDEQLKLYIDNADTSAAVHHACTLFVERYTRDGQPLPAVLAQWVLQMIRAPSVRPSDGRGRSKYANKGRDLIILEAIRIGKTAGLSVTRNEASYSTSVCDIVAEALTNEHGIPCSHEAIASVWKKRNKSNTGT